jgi:DNA-directed RNA polymerase specialized sigma24 family protein
VTSSRTEHTTHSTGARGAHHRARRTIAQTPPPRYEPYLDGLFTYCLSVLCDHDAATAVLGDVLAVAERQQNRCPSAVDRKAWLYALARWSCLRTLAEQKQKHKRGRAHTSGRASPDPAAASPRTGSGPWALVATGVPASEETLEQRRRELALLAWPEAAGTTPEQREALELAVRHDLATREVAVVLGMDAGACCELLAAAACEVERTRAALAVVDSGNCPIVARLTGDHQVLMGTALRHELVRHVDDCPTCRRAAERATAGSPWPGSGAVKVALPVVKAPRAAAMVAMTAGPRLGAKTIRRGGGPRFDSTGFPMDPKDYAARRDRLRSRAITATVVATVLAAPVLALWAAYRGAPQTGEARAGAPVSATEVEVPGALDGTTEGGRYKEYENIGNARAEKGPGFLSRDSRRTDSDLSVEVFSPGAASPPSGKGGGPGRYGPGRLTVEATGSGDTTVITLTASGGGPVRWSAHTDASWLRLSVSAGTLKPGESATIYVIVDETREPVGRWQARIRLEPSGALITVEGRGESASPPSPGHPGPSPRPDDPSTPLPSDPDPTAPPHPADPSTPPPSSGDSGPGSSPTESEPEPKSEPSVSSAPSA